MEGKLDFSKILCDVTKMAKECGKYIKDAFENRDEIFKTLEIKMDNPADLVTAIDKKVENSLKEQLMNFYPEFKFIGEETVAASEDKKVHLTDEPTWCIDPVDGTTNFVHGFPFTCISIALLIKKKPQIGIVYNPILEEIYTSERGKGSFMNGRKLPILKPAPLKGLKNSLIICEYGYDREPLRTKKKLNSLFSLLTSQLQGLRSLGSCALNMCMVARGGADAYFEKGMHVWDFSAGKLIIEEAGGIVEGWEKEKGNNQINNNINNTNNIDFINNFDMLGREVLCVRPAVEGRAKQLELLEEIRSKLEQFELEKD